MQNDQKQHLEILNKQVQNQHLFEFEKTYYILLNGTLALLLVLSILTITHYDIPVYEYFAAVLFGIVIIQFGFLLHDIQHRHISGNYWFNKIYSYVISNLICGISFAWWKNKHSKHHRYPNITDRDPDIYNIFTYSQEQANKRKGLFKFIARYQAYVYIPIVAWSTCYFRLLSISHLKTGQVDLKWLEGTLLCIHHFMYFYIFLYDVDTTKGLCLLLTSYISSGLYMAFVFTPNHMGMPINLDNGTNKLKSQIECTRNINTGSLGDIIFGGLNNQIEHHLFPGMPRNNLKKTRALTKAYCATMNFNYHETGILGAYREIFTYLHDIGYSLRRKEI